MLKRFVRHHAVPAWWLQRALPSASLDRIKTAVSAAEAGHAAEIRVAIEPRLGLMSLLRSQTPRQRAEEVFSLLRVWDTAANNGVLIYVLLADRQFEIVADRGIAAAVPQAEWERLCQEMENHFRSGRHEEAVLHGIRAIGERFEPLFPRYGGDVNELPDQPALL